MHFSFLFLLGTSVAHLTTATSLATSNSLSGKEGVIIATAEDLIKFSEEVNGGKDYSGSTVYLGADIDFTDDLSKQFKPIGKYADANFHGTFDGRGYVISNLTIEGAEVATGLFGYSNGLTIRNVVLDPSSSVNAASKATSYAGGILGNFEATHGECLVENSVSMASVSTSGQSCYSVGGIVGYASVLDYGGIIRNCANYGSISVSIESVPEVYIGGIVGHFTHFRRTLEAAASIWNSINTGDIQYNGSPRTFYVGGICGYSRSEETKNCVNAGAIQPQEGEYVGSIAGYLNLQSEVENCYWNGNSSGSCVGEKDQNATVTESPWFDETTFELGESVSVCGYTGNSLVDALNAFAASPRLEKYSRWLLNPDSSVGTFEITGRNSASPIAIDAQFILTPGLADIAPIAFDGWYTDAECTVPFTDSEISEDVKLYGLMKEDLSEHTVSFNTRGGLPVEQIGAKYGSKVKLPENPKKRHCTFVQWETEAGDVVSDDFVMPPYDVTLYASWSCISISTPQEFIEFSDKVHQGSNYSGMTIYLDADIDFAGGFSEELKDLSNFRGTFDGQGHVIRNLVYKEFDSSTGLFSRAKGLTVRNVVMDSSCSCPVAYQRKKGPDVFVGGIIGYYVGKEDNLFVENCVNMVNLFINVTSLKTNPIVYAGGIVGCSSRNKVRIVLKNCANYGSINFSGKSLDIYAGGIFGYSDDTFFTNVVNCINYGAINPGPVEDNFFVGGIFGYIWSENATFENCVSVGPIDAKGYTRVGAIAGFAGPSKTRVAHCFWTNETGVKEAVGSEATVTDSHLIAINEQCVKELNDYAKKYNWNKWVLNKDNGSVTFVVGGDRVNEMGWTAPGSSITLLMNPADNENDPFSGWFTDSSYDTHFAASEISGAENVLYGKWCDIAVKFGAGDVAVLPGYKGVIYGKTYGELPVPEKTGHTFVGWNTEKGIITSETVVAINEAHTAHAIIVVSNYTLTFDFKNETMISSLVAFNETIVYPEDMKRKGYSFMWNDTIERMPAHDVTISAVWTKENTHNTVVIVVPIVVFVVVVVVVVVVIVVYRRKKRSVRGRRSDDFYADELKKPLGAFSEDNVNEALDDNEN